MVTHSHMIKKDRSGEHYSLYLLNAYVSHELDSLAVPHTKVLCDTIHLYEAIISKHNYSLPSLN